MIFINDPVNKAPCFCIVSRLYNEQENNMKKVDLMIFDFDGTLADTGADLVASINLHLDGDAA